MVDLIDVRRGEPPPDPARLVRLAAWAVPLCVLPSAVWRVFVLDLPAGCPDSLGDHVYRTGLSVVSLASAFLTVGLVSPWGTIAPRWLPGMGGRRLSPRAVVVCSALGMVVLAAAYAWAALNPVFGWREPPEVPGCPPPNETDGAWLAYACYAPLLAWLPLLAFVTVDYWRRHRDADGR